MIIEVINPLISAPGGGNLHRIIHNNQFIHHPHGLNSSVVSTSAYKAAGPGFDSRSGHVSFGRLSVRDLPDIVLRCQSCIDLNESQVFATVVNGGRGL